MDPIPSQNTVANGSQMPPMPPEKKPVGPIAGAIIVIILLVAGGLYFWGAQLNKMDTNNAPYIPSDEMMMEEPTTLESDASAGLPPQSDSDDTASIEADFNAMNMQQMESENEAELNNI